MGERMRPADRREIEVLETRRHVRAENHVERLDASGDRPPARDVPVEELQIHAMIGDARAMFRSCGSGATASPCPVRTEPAVSYGAAQQAAAYKP